MRMSLTVMPIPHAYVPRTTAETSRCTLANPVLHTQGTEKFYQQSNAALETLISRPLECVKEKYRKCPVLS
jgi:hypothetical protein